jgi:hypothetical protein
MFARPCTLLLQMISPFALSVAMVLAGFYMLCRMMTTKKNYLSTAPAWCNKIINQSLTPYYQISEYISSFIENSLEQHQTAS